VIGARFSDPFIRRPVLATVLSLAIAVVGLFALTRLPVREFPAFEAPFVQVVTAFPGASAEQVEQLLSVPIERAASAVNGVDLVTSVSAPGLSTVQVAFGSGVDPGRAADEVRARLSAILGQLPRAAGLPDISQPSADAVPVVYLSLASPGRDARELTELARRVVQPRLVALPGVAQAQLFGERRHAVRIGFDPMALAARDLAPADLAQALRVGNADQPLGEVAQAGARVPVIARTAPRLPEEFGSLPLRAGSDYVVTLSHVAQVRMGSEAEDSAVLLAGRPALAIGVLRQSTANALSVAAAVRAELPAIAAALPAGVTLEVSFDGSLYVAASVQGVFSAMGEALLLVTAVILLFIGALRPTLVTAVTIPLSLLGTCGFLLAAGFTLNTFTLLAMVLAVGLVVDDAILDVENTQRHIRLGLAPMDASFIASREIGFAIVATTATLAAVFLPIGLMPGAVGALFREFAFTLAAAVIISGLISRTLSPMLSGRVLSARQGRLQKLAEGFSARLAAGYGRVLRPVLRWRWVALPLAVGLLVLAAGGATRLPSEIVPREDPGYVMVRFQGPPGASSAVMEAGARAVHAVFETVPERAASLVVTGTPAREEGFAFLGLAPWAERGRSAAEIGRAIQPTIAMIPGAAAAVADPSPFAGGGQAPVQAFLRGTGTREQVEAAMRLLRERARALPELADVQTDEGRLLPRLEIRLDHAMAADRKVSAAAVLEAVSLALGGSVVTRFAWGGELHPVILELDDLSRAAEALRELQVRNADGDLVPLSLLVEPRMAGGLDALRRFAQLPAVRLTADLAPGATLGSAVVALEAAAREVLPPGIALDFDGPARQLRQADAQVAVVFLLALVFIYLFLAAQFESFRDPLIVLGAVPFALAGAAAGLGALGGTLNSYSAIGLITLVGLTAKNGILIVEFINQLRDEGRDFADAVAEGAALRLRPVLMTSVATILGALPLLLDGGPGAGGRQQIGAVIVAGMAAGTLVSLLVVPLLYRVVARRRRPALPVPPR
jgi:multidrug efflux pump